MRRAAHFRGLGVVNFVEPTQAVWVASASARPHQYAVVKTCDAQRHLVAAGALPRDGVDGFWGPQSRSAMARFVNALPSTIRGLVYTDASGQAAALPFGLREDYRIHSGTEIRIPAAYVLALPPKANVPCTGGSQTTNTTVTLVEDDQTTTSTDTTTETGEDEQLVTPPSPQRTAEKSSSGNLWLIVAGLALGAIGIAAARQKGR